MGISIAYTVSEFEGAYAYLNGTGTLAFANGQWSDNEWLIVWATDHYYLSGDSGAGYDMTTTDLQGTYNPTVGGQTGKFIATIQIAGAYDPTITPLRLDETQIDLR